MSTYWHIECTTCDVGSGDMGNRVDRALEALAAEWPAVRGAIALRNRLDRDHVYTFDLRAHTGGDCGNGDGFEPFMMQHAEHALELVNEYRERKALRVGRCDHVFHHTTDFCRVCGMSAESVCAGLST